MEKHYDLEDRTEEYAKSILKLCQKLPKSVLNIELISQEIRSAGSIGANYIEANEAISKKDFAYRIKICRKEAKESRYWLKLIGSANLEFEKEINNLMTESTELMNIFGAILKKTISDH
jgi:four helix bundle protein